MRQSIKDLAGLVMAVGLAIIGGTATAGAEPASAWVESYNSKARLIAGSDLATKRLHAGVHLVLASGWKTYWRHPGDSGGVPPFFDWAGSSNLKAAHVLYPAPTRLKDATGDAIGYKEAVVFPVALTAIDSSKPITLKLALEYGICREICVPAEAKLELEVPTDGMQSASTDLASALARVPREGAARRPSDPALKSAKAILAGDKPSLTLQANFPAGTTGADMYIEAPDGIYVPLPKKSARAEGTVVEFEVDLTNGVEPQDLKGKQLLITLVSDGGHAEATWTVE